MSFQDLINQAKAELEQHTGGNDIKKVSYPTTKHKGVYFGKNTPELYFQLLPSADLNSTFAVPFRTIFLEAKTSKGKELKQSFTLDAEPNPGSILEKAIAEWTDKQMLPSPYGQVKPRRFYKVNIIKVVTQQVINPATNQMETQYVQERDQEGKYVVRTLDLPLSAYNGIIEKLGNPMLNPQGPNGSPMSFMDVNKPAMIHVARPLPNTTAYRVEVYPLATLPALVDGWQHELEDLHAQVVPTERLENGLNWVETFINIKNGVNPNANNQQSSQAPAQGQAPTAPPVNPYAQQPAPTPTAPPVTNQYTAPTAPPIAPNQYTAPTVTAPSIQQPVTPTLPPSAPMGAGTDLQMDNVPDFGVPNVPNTPPVAPVVPPSAPVAPTMPAQEAPTNSQGLPDIDSQLNNLLKLD
jgi:hypothetical protein